MSGDEEQCIFRSMPRAADARESSPRIAAEPTREERRVMEKIEVFQLFMQHKKLVMNCSDLRVALRVWGVEITREQLQAFTTLFSSDGKTFTQHEFLDICSELESKRSDADREQQLAEGFSLFDASASGVLTAKQLSKSLAKLTTFDVVPPGAEEIDETEIASMFADLDISSGGLTKTQFLDLMRSSETIP